MMTMSSQGNASKIAFEVAFASLGKDRSPDAIAFTAQEAERLGWTRFG